MTAIPALPALTAIPALPVITALPALPVITALPALPVITAITLKDCECLRICFSVWVKEALKPKEMATKKII